MAFTGETRVSTGSTPEQKVREEFSGELGRIQKAFLTAQPVEVAKFHEVFPGGRIYVAIRKGASPADKYGLVIAEIFKGEEGKTKVSLAMRDFQWMKLDGRDVRPVARKDPDDEKDFQGDNFRTLLEKLWLEFPEGASPIETHIEPDARALFVRNRYTRYPLLDRETIKAEMAIGFFDFVYDLGYTLRMASPKGAYHGAGGRTGLRCGQMVSTDGVYPDADFSLGMSRKLQDIFFGEDVDDDWILEVRVLRA